MNLLCSHSAGSMLWAIHLMIFCKCIAKKQNAAVTVQESFIPLSQRNGIVFSSPFSKQKVCPVTEISCSVRARNA